MPDQFVILDNVSGVVVSAFAAYLLGSLPFAYLVARFGAGVDIFEIGTGNPGASNVFRKVGRKYGALVFALDILKGVAAVYVAKLLECPENLVPVASAFAIVGHWWPVFLRFRGGAGLATGVGIGVALIGVWGLVAATVGILLIPIFRDGPRAAVVTLVVAVVIAFVNGPDWVALGGMALIAVLLLLRLFLVEFPRDRRGDRPEPHIRN